MTKFISFLSAHTPTKTSLGKPVLGMIFTLLLNALPSTMLYAEEAGSGATDSAGDVTEDTTSTTEGESTDATSDTESEEEANTPKITLTTADWHDIERLTVSPDKTKINLLLKEVDERELVKLQANDEEFIGLFLEYNTAQPLGAVLILHDEGLTPDNNQLIAPLRKYLPDYGWNTLAIAIPEPDTTPLPERKWPKYPADFTLNPPAEEPEEGTTEETPEGDAADAEATSEEATNSETADPTETEDQVTESNDTSADAAQNEETQDETAKQTPEEKGPTAQEITMMRIGAAVQDLIQRGQLNIVLIGQGIGASWAVSYLQSSGNQDMFTLVMIDPKLPKTEADKNYINTRLGKFGELPILDIVSQQTTLSKREAKERSNVSRRKQLSTYQQLFTRPVNDPWTEHHRIVKRVRGWLAQNAPGEEQPIQ